MTEEEVRAAGGAHDSVRPTDLDEDHVSLAASAQKRARTLLGVAGGIVLVGAAIALAVTWTEHVRLKKLGVAWASFQVCTVGQIPQDRSPGEIRYFITMTERVRQLGDTSEKHASADADLLGCTKYAKQVLDLVDTDAKGTDFRKRIADFTEGPGPGMLDGLWTAGNEYHIPIGKPDPSVSPPVTGKPRIEWAPTLRIPAGRSLRVPFSTAGQRRIALQGDGTIGVCDFSDNVACSTFPFGFREQGADEVLSAPPLGGSIVVGGPQGSAIAQMGGGFAPLPSDAARVFQAGTAEPRFVQSGDAPDTIDVMSWSGGGPKKVTTVDTKGLTQPTVRIFWDHLLLIGAESGGDIPADQVWPSLFSIDRNGKRTKIGRFTNNQDFDEVVGCKAGDTTYVSLRDLDEDYARYPTNLPDAWLLTFHGDSAAIRQVAIRFPRGNVVWCDEKGFTFHMNEGDLFCPLEGQCKSVPAPSVRESDTVCHDGTRRFALGTVDDAIIFASAPTDDPGGWKPSWLIDGRNQSLGKPKVLCLPGHAYGLIDRAVLDLETDPPTFR